MSNERSIKRIEGLLSYLEELLKVDDNEQILEDIETLKRSLKILKNEE